MKATTWMVALVAASGLALAGCGGDKAGDTKPAADAAAKADVNYKCAKEGCTKTKTAKAGDKAPEC